MSPWCHHELVRQFNDLSRSKHRLVLLISESPVQLGTGDKLKTPSQVLILQYLLIQRFDLLIHEYNRLKIGFFHREQTNGRQTVLV